MCQWPDRDRLQAVARLAGTHADCMLASAFTVANETSPWRTHRFAKDHEFMSEMAKRVSIRWCQTVSPERNCRALSSTTQCRGLKAVDNVRQAVPVSENKRGYMLCSYCIGPGLSASLGRRIGSFSFHAYTHRAANYAVARALVKAFIKVSLRSYTTVMSADPA